jgi:hypothetical protein
MAARGTMLQILDGMLEQRITVHTHSQDYMGVLYAVGADVICMSDNGPAQLAYVQIRHIVKFEAVA